MYTTYRLRADELSSSLITSIKSIYQNREIEIIIREVQDETEYLLSNDENRRHLLKGIEELDNRQNLTFKDEKEL